MLRRQELIASKLREAGLKATGARREVLSLMDEEGRPLKAGEIWQELGKKAPNQATVYRILACLVDAKLVKRIQLEEGVLSYEVADMPHHHHVVCERCGLVRGIKMNCEELNPTHASFKLVNQHSLEFTGICRKCGVRKRVGLV